MHPESLKLDLGLIVSHDQSQNLWSPMSMEQVLMLSDGSNPEWRKMRILVDWCREVNQAHGPRHLDHTWHHMLMNPHKFAQQLRALGWCVYHYRDREGLDHVPDFMAYVNYGKRWGLIVAPYCARLTAWRLMQ